MSYLKNENASDLRAASYPRPRYGRKARPSLIGFLCMGSIAFIVVAFGVSIYSEIKDRGVKSGTVVYREFVEAHMRPYKPFTWISDAWVIGVEGETPLGEIRTRKVEVSEGTYYETPMGKRVRVENIEK